jgi:DNA-binding Xre family transcriptional regulator
MSASDPLRATRGTAYRSESKRTPTPLVRFLLAADLRRIDLAAEAGVDLKVVHRLCTGDYLGIKLATLHRVASALGCAPAELVPELVRRPRKGLLYDRGVLRLKR